MTAELAIALPAVALLVACAIGGVAVAGAQVTLTDAAGQAVRLVARGDGGADDVMRAVDAEWSVSASGAMECVRARRTVTIAGALRVRLEARQCALAGGR